MRHRTHIHIEINNHGPLQHHPFVHTKIYNVKKKGNTYK
jgi:hypothetical protein